MDLEKTSQPSDDDFAAIRRAMELIGEAIRFDPSIKGRAWVSALFSLVAHCYRNSRIPFEEFQATVMTFLDVCKKEWE